LKALRESERRFALLVNSTVEYAIYTLDPAGLVNSWNPGAELIKGYARDEVFGRHYALFYTEEDRQAGKPARALMTALAEGQFREEGWRVRKDGSRFWASVLLQVLRDTDGQPDGFAKIMRDETQRRIAEQARAAHLAAQRQSRIVLEAANAAREQQQAQSKRWLELAEEIAHVGHWTISVPGQDLFWSDEIYRIHGLEKGVYTPEIGSAINVFHPGDRDRIVAAMNGAIAEKSGYEWQARLIRPDGGIRHVLSRGVVQLNEQSQVTAIFGVFIDMTEQKQIEQRLEHANFLVTQANEALKVMAHIDGLTGLPNRRAFERTLDAEYRRAVRERTAIGLIMVDLDHFKGFNDVYGHPAGDECLRRVAAAISGALNRPSDFAARYGGEEIAVLLPNTGLAGANAVAQSILEAVRGLGIAHRRSAEGIVTVSCGVAAVEGAVDIGGQAGLVERADRALYRVKTAGRNRVGWFGEDAAPGGAGGEGPAGPGGTGRAGRR
jgi:diguanylate cyclase (GGDEF)-like protein/PAS domain S-box-containing protein